MPPIFPKILVTFLFTRLKSDCIFDLFWPEVNRKLKPINFSPCQGLRGSTRGRERKLSFNFFVANDTALDFASRSAFIFEMKLFRWKFNHLFLVAENEFRFGGGGEYLQWRVIEDNCPNCQFDSTTKPVIMLMEKEEYAATWIKLCKIQNFWEISRDQRSFHPYFR